MIISRTPFRVSFLGGSTDYPVWYREHGGAVLTSTIDRYCYLMVRWLPPFFPYRHRVTWTKIELADRAADIEHPAVRAVIEYLGIERGLSVHHDGDLPARTGLGSSSAFTVGLLHALQALCGRSASQALLAKQAIHVEQDLMGETVGVQDQIECAHGGLNLLEIDREGVWTVNRLTIPAKRQYEFESCLLLYYTGISRHASEIAAAQVAATPGRRGELSDMLALVREGAGVLTGYGRLEEFGRLLDESWRLKRSLTQLVSTPEVDRIYELARANGAIGGKLLGAGGGGFVLLFARPEDQGRLRHALDGVLEIPFRFESGGSRIVFSD